MGRSRPAMQQNRVPWRGGPVSGDVWFMHPVMLVFPMAKGDPKFRRMKVRISTTALCVTDS